MDLSADDMANNRELEIMYGTPAAPGIDPRVAEKAKNEVTIQEAKEASARPGGGGADISQNV